MQKNGFDMEKQKVMLPKDMMTKPFFPAVPEEGPRTIAISEDKSYLIGYRDKTLWKFGQERSFDIRHGKLIILLLGLVERHKIENLAKETPLPLKVSIYQLCKAYYRVGRPSKTHYTEIADLLGDLRSIVVKYTDKENFRIFTLLFYGTEFQKKGDKGPSFSNMKLTSIQISPFFLEYFLNIETLNIRCDVLFSLKSDMAMAIYFYVPSRAAMKKPGEKFEINFETLLNEVARGNKINSKSERLRSFFRPERELDVFKDLDGRETLTGILRAAYEDIGDDYKAIFWIEKISEPPKDDTFIKYLFQKNNIPMSQFSMYTKTPINGYAQDKLKSIGINTDKNTEFYTLCQNIIGEMAFNSIVGQMAAELNSGTSSIASPGAVLGHRLKKALQDYFKAFQTDLFPDK